jgi:hypothetical protein
MNSASKKPVGLVIAFVAEMAAHDALPDHVLTVDKAVDISPDLSPTGHYPP